MPFRPHPDGVAATIRLTPGARSAGIHGVMETGDGRRALKISVTAVPEDGKANKALLVLLAKEWRVPKTSLSLLSGDTHRVKTVLAAGDTGALMEKIRTATFPEGKEC